MLCRVSSSATFLTVVRQSDFNFAVAAMIRLRASYDDTTRQLFNTRPDPNPRVRVGWGKPAGMGLPADL